MALNALYTKESAFANLDQDAIGVERDVCVRRGGLFAVDADAALFDQAAGFVLALGRLREDQQIGQRHGVIDFNFVHFIGQGVLLEDVDEVLLAHLCGGFIMEDGDNFARQFHLHIARMACTVGQPLLNRRD